MIYRSGLRRFNVERGTTKKIAAGRGCTYRVGDGPLPETQQFSGGHGGGGGLGRSVGRRYLLPVLGELVHHPHAHQSHRGQQGQPDEVHVRLDGGAHHQHQESDQREPHGFPRPSTGRMDTRASVGWGLSRRNGDRRCSHRAAM